MVIPAPEETSYGISSELCTAVSLYAVFATVAMLYLSFCCIKLLLMAKPEMSIENIKSDKNNSTTENESSILIQQSNIYEEIITTKIKEKLVKDSDNVYEKFVFFPQRYKSDKKITESYDSNDHLKFLMECSVQDNNGEDTQYLKARTLLPTEECPEDLRSLIKSVKAKPPVPPKLKLTRSKSDRNV